MCFASQTTSKRAGLPRLRLHDLRHTFGTQAIHRFKIHEVQRMTGHPITTTERYRRYVPDPEGVVKLTGQWAPSDAEQAADRSNVIALRRAA